MNDKIILEKQIQELIIKNKRLEESNHLFLEKMDQFKNYQKSKLRESLRILEDKYSKLVNLYNLSNLEFKKKYNLLNEKNKNLKKEFEFKLKEYESKNLLLKNENEILLEKLRKLNHPGILFDDEKHIMNSLKGLSERVDKYLNEKDDYL